VLFQGRTTGEAAPVKGRRGGLGRWITGGEQQRSGSESIRAPDTDEDNKIPGFGDLDGSGEWTQPRVGLERKVEPHRRACWKRCANGSNKAGRIYVDRTRLGRRRACRGQRRAVVIGKAVDQTWTGRPALQIP